MYLRYDIFEYLVRVVFGETNVCLHSSRSFSIRMSAYAVRDGQVESCQKIACEYPCPLPRYDGYE